MRRHSEQNIEQHQEFLTQLDSEQRNDYLEWFRTLPVWLELEDGLRIVHACWHQESIDFISQRRLPGERLSDEFIVEANTKRSPLYEACETVLKGPECNLTDSGLPKFLDKADHPRASARIRWWKTDAVDLRDLAEIPDDSLAESRDPYPFHLLDGHEPPYLVHGDKTQLAPGMCFSDEPGIYIPGEFGIRLEDCWQMTETGPKLFTPLARSLEDPI
jgi:hypothetical protein